MLQDLPDTYRHPLPNGLYYDMVRVRPGVFVMGSEGEGAYHDEELEHLVQVTKDYYLGIYPVTQAVWKAVMDGYNPSFFIGDNRPVEEVSWQDIVEGGQDEEVQEGFLPRLNAQYPLEEEALSGFAFRLPTEAEWEYAARGGHKTALSPEQVQSILTTNQPKAAELYTTYAGSNQLKEVSWYKENSHRETKTVCKRAPNELGLNDMNGNVFEWCQDWFGKDFYAKCKEQDVVRDPMNTKNAEDRVYRGGSWNSKPRGCRVSYRNYWHPAYRGDFVGFRLALAPV